ncbi:methyltransferase [Phytopseudomonas punonensis]|uniref:Methyltransferase domain-containing protein n=1 Tax=Phytopseudomonas punonensis TaxID=1220495 RepID=A0A1M6YTM9_9GAMM|nr:methyltransferase [Pseudomonas punonensis]SHL21412.1 Methyltransferase domain-containing protein [Pseudomonas punonensis]
MTAYNCLPPLSGDALLQRFQALDGFLVAHQALWKPRPFTHQTLPWESQHPELAAWLRSRTLEQAEASHNQPAALDGAPAPFPELALQAERLSQIGDLPQQPSPDLPPRFSVDVPGRKWQQIRAFSDSLQFAQTPQHWLDWCAGKGHLGRVLAHEGQQLTCLEYDPALVANGAELSKRLGITAQHIEQDVLADNASQHMHAAHSPVALHACGDLHVRLMHLASAAGCHQLAIAPCCYNRTVASTYQALSTAAQDSILSLSLDDLALPMSETVTAGNRVRLQRDQSMAWRLAFDLLQRELRGVDDYLPTPSLPPVWLKKDFTDYCRDLAELKRLPTPSERDWHRLETAGWQRLAEVRNLELLRGLFRRPLELWLVLDRALYLQEQGYEVRLGQFCPPHLTPRNLLLLAERAQVAHTICG